MYGIFDLKCLLLIEFVLQNLSQIYFCIPEIFETITFQTGFCEEKKSPFEFVLSSCYSQR